MSRPTPPTGPRFLCFVGPLSEQEERRWRESVSEYGIESGTDYALADRWPPRNDKQILCLAVLGRHTIVGFALGVVKTAREIEGYDVPLPERMVADDVPAAYVKWAEVHPTLRGRRLGLCRGMIAAFMRTAVARGAIGVALRNVAGAPGCVCYLNAARDAGLVSAFIEARPVRADARVITACTDLGSGVDPNYYDMLFLLHHVADRYSFQDILT